ncbi:hypothetical protein WJX79_002455 [Trebouxia sp. C0005]
MPADRALVPIQIQSVKGYRGRGKCLSNKLAARTSMHGHHLHYMPYWPGVSMTPAETAKLRRSASCIGGDFPAGPDVLGPYSAYHDTDYQIVNNYLLQISDLNAQLGAFL